ncbi:MAG: M1 family metallopeptidase, partial [Polaribacter sp.]
MRIALIVFILLTKTLSLFSQDIVYRAEREKTFDLIHTKLKVDFNFSNQTMNGEAWITLTPHFYETNTVVLDAKAMIINSVTLINKPLSFEYKNKRKLEIKLPKVYKKGEELTLYIDYVAQPEKVYQKGSTAITSAKGLYFINADGKDKNKPTQIWTQGETEASSCWFPTIDAPNQKTSQEIYITVPKKYVTLSNGTLISQKTKDGNRTDYWKLDQKHAP